jgi:hypothetical protein
MAEPADMIVPLLRDIQAELVALRRETGERLDKLEAGQKNIRSALAGYHSEPPAYRRVRGAPRRTGNQDREAGASRMTPVRTSTADRVRMLRSRKLDFANYSRELLAVADLSENEVSASEASAERFMSLRSRLRRAESRLRDIEAAQ